MFDFIFFQTFPRQFFSSNPRIFRGSACFSLIVFKFALSRSSATHNPHPLLVKYAWLGFFLQCFRFFSKNPIQPAILPPSDVFALNKCPVKQLHRTLRQKLVNTVRMRCLIAVTPHTVGIMVLFYSLLYGKRAVRIFFATPENGWMPLFNSLKIITARANLSCSSPISSQDWAIPSG